MSGVESNICDACGNELVGILERISIGVWRKLSGEGKYMPAAIPTAWAVINGKTYCARCLRKLMEK